MRIVWITCSGMPATQALSTAAMTGAEWWLRCRLLQIPDVAPKIGVSEDGRHAAEAMIIARYHDVSVVLGRTSEKSFEDLRASDHPYGF